VELKIPITDCPSPQFCPALKSTTLECGENLICCNMFDLFCLWFGAALRIFRNQQDLLLENLALRQGLKPALILDVLRGAEAPLFRVTVT
jgi:hypothetical protein